MAGPSGVSICKVGLLSCTYNGKDIKLMTHCIRIYETMCKAYRTAEVVMLNDHGQVTGIPGGVNVGDEVTFSILDSWGQIYNMTSYVTAAPDTLNSAMHEDMVTIGTVTSAFMKDKANIVQHSAKNEVISATAQAIHSMYIGTPLQLPVASIGMIAMDQIGSYISSGEHPITAIRNMIARAKWPGASGAAVYFENKFGASLGPLEYYLNESPVGLKLIDSTTWGTDYRHIFGGAGAVNAVLAHKIYHKDGQAGGAGDQAKAAGQSTTLFSQDKRTAVMNAIPSVNIPNLAKFISSGSGGIAIHSFMDGARNNMSIDPALQAAAENAVKAKVKDGTNFLIKSTIESGFNDSFTVGNRITAFLRAPLESPTEVFDGTLLLADVMHECYFDNRIVSGTTTSRCVVV